MQKFSLLITSYIFHFILLTHHHNCTGSYCCKFIDHWSCFFFTNSLVSFSLIHPCTFFFKFIDPICLFLWSTPVSFTINSLIHSVFSWIHPCMFYWSASSCCRSWFLLLSNSPSLRSLSEEPLSPPYQWTSHSHEQVITMDQSRQPTN